MTVRTEPPHNSDIECSLSNFDKTAGNLIIVSCLSVTAEGARIPIGRIVAVVSELSDLPARRVLPVIPCAKRPRSRSTSPPPATPSASNPIAVGEHAEWPGMVVGQVGNLSHKTVHRPETPETSEVFQTSEVLG